MMMMMMESGEKKSIGGRLDGVFCVLCSVFCVLCSMFYASSVEGGVAWNE